MEVFYPKDGPEDVHSRRTKKAPRKVAAVKKTPRKTGGVVKKAPRKTIAKAKNAHPTRTNERGCKVLTAETKRMLKKQYKTANDMLVGVKGGIWAKMNWEDAFNFIDAGMNMSF